MSKTTLAILSSILLSSALATPATATRQQQSPGNRPFVPHYVLFDVGTFGGHFSGLCGLACRIINSGGTVVGIDATRLHDPFDPDCFYDCHADHAFEWKYGGTSDLGSLRYRLSSFALGINAKGLVTGISQNGAVDPDTGIPEVHGVVWPKESKARDIGTLGGTQSAAGPGINASGHIAVQSSTSDTSDPYIGIPQANCIWLPTTERDCGGLDFGINALFFPVTTAVHGGIWTKDAGLNDTGTLGGPDSTVNDINDSGQAVGWSYVSYDAGQSGVPDTHPFLWDNGTAVDLGTLGGTFGEATLINKNGQVTGTANTDGDVEVRPFIWDNVNGMQDLGSLGGDYGHGDWLNDQGDVVGFSRTTLGSIAGHAFYWHSGTMNDLGVMGDDPESEANAINNNGMIIGEDFDRNVGDLRGWISDNGGQLTDLNTLIRKPHGLYVTAAVQINDRGVIAANATTAKGDSHAVVLVPEDDTAMIAQMNAVTRNDPQDESAPVSPPPRGSHASRPNCATADRRMRPAVCNRG